MIPEQYIWLAWSLGFLVPWMGLYWAFPQHRRATWWSSVFTMPFGLTEPLFVPEYWNPPSLFNLAQRTGFDIESLIFCFGIGGVGAVLYSVLTRRAIQPVPPQERHEARHQYHAFVLALPFVAFVALYWLPWNPIYPGIVAMLIGAAGSMWCRPDLIRKSWVGGLLFLGYYVVFLIGLQVTAPGYIDRVWNHAALTGVHLFGMPVEELLFALGFGLYWSSVYEHLTWKRVEPGRATASEGAARGTGDAAESVPPMGHHKHGASRQQQPSDEGGHHHGQT